LFRLLYGSEDAVDNVIIVDLNSTDNTSEILGTLARDYGCIKVSSWDECKSIVDNIENN